MGQAQAARDAGVEILVGRVVGTDPSRGRPRFAPDEPDAFGHLGPDRSVVFDHASILTRRRGRGALFV